METAVNGIDGARRWPRVYLIGLDSELRTVADKKVRRQEPVIWMANIRVREETMNSHTVHPIVIFYQHVSSYPSGVLTRRSCLDCFEFELLPCLLLLLLCCAATPHMLRHLLPFTEGFPPPEV
jgi:hypothetical protein